VETSLSTMLRCPACHTQVAVVPPPLHSRRGAPLGTDGSRDIDAVRPETVPAARPIQAPVSELRAQRVIPDNVEEGAHAVAPSRSTPTCPGVGVNGRGMRPVPQSKRASQKLSYGSKSGRVNPLGTPARGPRRATARKPRHSTWRSGQSTRDHRCRDRGAHPGGPRILTVRFAKPVECCQDAALSGRKSNATGPYQPPVSSVGGA
jgi:hypothetical protein